MTKGPFVLTIPLGKNIRAVQASWPAGELAAQADAAGAAAAGPAPPEQGSGGPGFPSDEAVAASAAAARLAARARVASAETRLDAGAAGLPGAAVRLAAEQGGGPARVLPGGPQGRVAARGAHIKFGELPQPRCGLPRVEQCP